MSSINRRRESFHKLLWIRKIAPAVLAALCEPQFLLRTIAPFTHVFAGFSRHHCVELTLDEKAWDVKGLV